MADRQPKLTWPIHTAEVIFNCDGGDSMAEHATARTGLGS